MTLIIIMINTVFQLKALSNGGAWKEGQRFSSGVDSATVVDWLNQK